MWFVKVDAYNSTSKWALNTGLVKWSDSSVWAYNGDLAAMIIDRRGFSKSNSYFTAERVENITFKTD